MRKPLLALALLPSLLAGCEKQGVCVEAVGNTESCIQPHTRAECARLAGLPDTRATFTEGQTCPQLGYATVCGDSRAFALYARSDRGCDAANLATAQRNLRLMGEPVPGEPRRDAQ